MTPRSTGVPPGSSRTIEKAAQGGEAKTAGNSEFFNRFHKGSHTASSTRPNFVPLATSYETVGTPSAFRHDSSEFTRPAGPEKSNKKGLQCEFGTDGISGAGCEPSGVTLAAGVCALSLVVSVHADVSLDSHLPVPLPFPLDPSPRFFLTSATVAVHGVGPSAGCGLRQRLQRCLSLASFGHTNLFPWQSPVWNSVQSGFTCRLY